MSSDDIAEITRKSASLPRDYYAQSTMSIYDLLKLSGYFDAHSNIGELELAEVFENESYLVTDWLRHSENKRGGDGWYIVSEKGKYIVGHLGKGNRFSFSDQLQATAFFAKHELESIRGKVK